MALPDALSVWREEVGRRLLNLDFRAASDQPFTFSMRPILMTGGVRLVANQHAPGFTFRDRDLVKDGNDSLALVYPVQGRMSYSQRGEVVLGVNEPVLIDTSVPGELGARISCSYISLIFPSDTLPAHLDRRHLENRRWPRGSPALRLLRSYIDTLAGSRILPQTELAETARRHLLDLVRLAASECDEASQVELLGSDTIAEARVRIALAEIEAHFRNPNLSETDIAIRQGITPRHLQRLLERAGLRFTECVNTLRLDAAHRALANPALGHLSVIEIALDSGFCDISHFNRVFKRRFGATPTEIRLASRRN